MTNAPDHPSAVPAGAAGPVPDPARRRWLRGLAAVVRQPFEAATAIDLAKLGIPRQGIADLLGAKLGLPAAGTRAALTIAAAGGTLGYELMCGLNARVPKIVV